MSSPNTRAKWFAALAIALSAAAPASDPASVDATMIREKTAEQNGNFLTPSPQGVVAFKVKATQCCAWIEGTADRVEHDSRTKVTQLTGHVVMRNGVDEVKGDRVTYDANANTYSVTGSAGRRATAVIHPKLKNEDSPHVELPAQQIGVGEWRQ